MNSSRKIIAAAILGGPCMALAQTIDLTVDIATPRSTPEAAVNAALTIICDEFNTTPPAPSDANANRLFQVCSAVTDSGANINERIAALKQLSAKASSAAGALTARIPAGYSLGAVGQHLAALRRGAVGFAVGTLGFNINGVPIVSDREAPVSGGSAGGALGADDTGQRSAFGNVSFMSTKHDETATVSGFSGSNTGITGGADYRLTDRAFVGAAAGYHKADLDLDGLSGSLEGDGFNVMAYGTQYIRERLYVEGIIGMHSGNFDLSRNIDFTVGNQTFTDRASSSTSSSQLGASFSVGYETLFSNGIIGELIGGVAYSSSDIDSYTESGTTGINLVIKDQTVETLLVSVGGQIGRSLSKPWGVLVPQASLMLYQDLKSDGTDVTATFLSDPGQNQFTYRTADRDSAFAQLAFSATTIYPKGLMAFAQLETLLWADNYRHTVVSAGMRKDFQ